jgi:hypothetical protein
LNEHWPATYLLVREEGVTNVSVADRVKKNQKFVGECKKRLRGRELTALKKHLPRFARRAYGIRSRRNQMSRFQDHSVPSTVSDAGGQTFEQFDDDLRILLSQFNLSRGANGHSIGTHIDVNEVDELVDCSDEELVPDPVDTPLPRP